MASDTLSNLANATDRVQRLRESVLNLETLTQYTEINLLKSRAWRQSFELGGIPGELASLVYRRGAIQAYVLENQTATIGEDELVVGKQCRRALSDAEKTELDDWLTRTMSIRPQIGGMGSHMAIDFQKVLRLGCRGIEAQIKRKMSSLSYDQPDHLDKIAFYEACLLCLRALAKASNLWADEADRQASISNDMARKQELIEIARICRKVPEHPAETFYEAVQSMHFVNAMLTFHLPGLYQLGRPDRYLYPYYKRDIEMGRITKDRAQELWDCVCIALNDLVPKGLAVGYMVGGRDANGNDTSNELTEIMIESAAHTRLAYPGIGLCWHSGSPKHLMDRSAEILATGTSHPAIYNDETITNGLIGLGLPPTDACEYIHSTCVEISPIACSNVWVASPYINLLLPLHDAIGVGKDASTSYISFDELLQVVRSNLEAKVAEESRVQSLLRLGRFQQGGNPLLSCFVNDCIAHGKDIDQGGARYDWIEMSFVGLANLADSLAAIEQLVFVENSVTMDQLREAIETDYEGKESLRQLILNRVPKYGNDDEHVDGLAKMATEWANEACARNRVHPGTEVVAGFFCWIMHEYLGRQTCASPDGRKAGFPLGDGSGPAQGREKKGPTAAIKSTTSWDHTPMLGGIALNLKFIPGRDKASFSKSLSSLLETYCKQGGFEVQVNVVDNEVLNKAQQHPEQYRDLVVRIGGYSDYFVGLSPQMQEEVIARFEHASEV